jgi:hypothetical protein
MKKFILLLTIVLLGFSNQTQAHHGGGEIKVDYIGGNDYLVSVIFYWRCPDITPDSISVHFESGCGNFSALLPKVGSPIDIPFTCPSEPPDCNGGSLFGKIQKHIYQKQVTLAPCSDWVISWSSNSRNVSNNLFNGDTQDWYYYFAFNSLLSPGNHFPYFTTNPIYYITSGNTFHYNHGAIDPDGDSISYKFVAPMQDSGISCIYSPGYNVQQFMPSNPPVFEDQVTGDVVIHPYMGFIAAYDVEVTEWKNIAGIPTIVSRQIRDSYIYVTYHAADEIPVLSGINPSASAFSANDSTYRIPVIAGDTVDFNIYTHKPVPSELNLTYPKQITGSLLTVSQNNTPNAQGHFHWVPTSSQIVKGPAIFLARIADTVCPYFYYQIYSYSFDVNGLIVFLLPGNNNVNLLLGQSYNITATCTAANTFDWYVDGNLVLSDSIGSYTFLSQDLGPGDHTVGCKAYNSAKSNLKGFEFVNVHVQNLWGIDQAVENDLGIYPNPTNDMLNIKTSIKIESLKLFDPEGRLIQTFPATARQIDVRNLSRGIYILSINNKIFRKIILK